MRLLTKQKQIINKRFSKRQNAVPESETDTKQELQDLKNSINQKNPIEDQIYFSDSEATTPSSIKGKRKINKSYTNTPIRLKKSTRLYDWNQQI